MFTRAAQQDYPIQPIPPTKVRMSGGFWAPRLETNRTVTVPYDFRKCEETGRIDNFDVAGGLKEGGFQGIFFNDSDVFKVIEGAAYTLAMHPDPKLDNVPRRPDRQDRRRPGRRRLPLHRPHHRRPELQLSRASDGGRWSHLASGHELYNVGHLYEAAVAHCQVTGKRSLLDVAIKNADLICQVFGPDEEHRRARPRGNRDRSGQALPRHRRREIPAPGQVLHRHARPRRRATGLRQPTARTTCRVVEQAEAVGHAVARPATSTPAWPTSPRSPATSLHRRHRPDLGERGQQRRLYLTGGIGAAAQGEAFGDDYELPNAAAYAETCAAIANALWNHRMFLLHGDAKYIDVLERIIYNGFLAGVSLSGDEFFYPNPLASDGQ